MQFYYLVVFFKQFGILTLITAVFSYGVNLLLVKISEKHEKLGKFKDVLTFFFSCVFFIALRYFIYGEFSFDSSVFDTLLTVSTLSTVISVLIRYFLQNGRLPSKSTLTALALKELLYAVIKDDELDDTINEIVKLTEKTEITVKFIMQKHAKNDVSEEVLQDAVKRTVDYLKEIKIK